MQKAGKYHLIFLNTNFGKLVSGFSHLLLSIQLGNDFYNPPSLLLSLFLLTGKKIFYIVCFSFSSFYYLFIIYSFHFHSFIIIAIIIVQIYLFYFILTLFVCCISFSLSCVLSIFAILCSFVCAFVQLMFALQVVTPVVFLISSLLSFYCSFLTSSTDEGYYDFQLKFQHKHIMCVL